MGIDAREAQQRADLAAALRAAYIGPGELWLRYLARGGSVGEYEVNAYLEGMLSLPAFERDLLADAANELIDQIPPPARALHSHDSRMSRESPPPP